MDLSLSKRSFNQNRYYYDNNKQKSWKFKIAQSRPATKNPTLGT